MFISQQDLDTAIQKHRESKACEKGEHWWERICGTPWRCVVCKKPFEVWAYEMAAKAGEITKK